MSGYLIVLLLFLLSVPSTVLGDQGGFYYGGQLGVNLIDTVEAEGPNGPFNLSLAGGGMGSLLVGYDYADYRPRFAQGRVELELSWRQNALDTAEFADGSFSAGGDLSALSAMANFFYEYHGLKPLLAYYGVGVGVARVALDNATVTGVSLADDEDDVLAFQLGLGLGYQLSEDLAVDLGYRFFATEDPEFDDARGRKFTAEYQSHSILLGARCRF